jgi:hypothetical protein
MSAASSAEGGEISGGIYPATLNLIVDLVLTFRKVDFLLYFLFFLASRRFANPSASAALSPL